MIALLIKVTVVVAVGLGLAAFARRWASEQRHLALLVTIVVALALPLGTLVAPRWSAPILPAQKSGAVPFYLTTNAPRAPDVTVVTSPSTYAPPTERARVVAAPAHTSAVSGAGGLAVLWALGSLAVLAWIVAGHWRLALITRHAWPANDAAWTSLLGTEGVIAGVTRRVRLLITPEVSTPLTWGIGAPVILLPEDALDWSIDHRSVVLRHELAHVARRDTLSQLVAGITCAVYWFHPLIWVAARQLRAECERACDDRVLSTGTTAPDYATHLLTVARTARELGTPGFVALAMARPTRLEGRMRAILDSTRRRSPLTRTARLSATVLAIVSVLVVAAFRPVAHRVRTVSRLDPYVVTAAPPPLPAVLVSTPPLVQQIRADSTFTRSVPAQPGGTLTIRLVPSGGTVTITGWDEPRIDVRARLGGQNGPDTEVALREVAGGAELIASYRGNEHRTSFSNSFDIKVPRRYDVEIKSAGGSIMVNDVQGTVSGSTGGGNILVNRMKGTMHLGTGGGEVTVTNSDLHGSVTSGGGKVNFDGVKGGLVGDYSSSTSNDTNRNDGKVDAIGLGAGVGADMGAGMGSGVAVGTGIGIGSSSRSTTSITGPRGADSFADFGKGGIVRSRSGGEVVIDSAPNGAHIVTGGGDIRIGRSAGEVYLQTGGGRITVGPASGSVVATTGAGDLNVTFVGRGPHSGDLSTGKGSAVLVLPADFSGTLVLETAYTNNANRKTKIESEFPLTTTETPNWDSSHGTPRRYVRSKLVLGNGEGTIEVHVVNGDVIVRKSSR